MHNSIQHNDTEIYTGYILSPQTLSQENEVSTEWEKPPQLTTKYSYTVHTNLATEKKRFN